MMEPREGMGVRKKKRVEGERFVFFVCRVIEG